jgi:hypothetical protein
MRERREKLELNGAGRISREIAVRIEIFTERSLTCAVL